MNIRTEKIKYSETLIILTMWLLLFAAPLLMFSSDEYLYWENVLRSLKAVIPFFFLFLFNHFVLIPIFLFKRKKISYIVAAIITIIVFAFGLYFFEHGIGIGGPPPHEIQHRPPMGERLQIGPPNGLHQPPEKRANTFPYPPFINTIIVSILIIGFDTGLRMMMRWSVLEQEKSKLEKENVQNQLAFLRNQVSPHFFMNTLNNIHALIDIDTEEAKQSIISLSKLMRHILYESEAEKIPLNKELEFISNYVGLMKLRFSDKVKVELNIPGHIPDKQIPPLLFISFMENAFKHGVSYNADSFINIDIGVMHDMLEFNIVNSQHFMENDRNNSGIGIANSKKRLDLLFGNSYDLTINDNKNLYSLNLRIPL